MNYKSLILIIKLYQNISKIFLIFYLFLNIINKFEGIGFFKIKRMIKKLNNFYKLNDRGLLIIKYYNCWCF